jgi:hypothetical protein
MLALRTKKTLYISAGLLTVLFLLAFAYLLRGNLNPGSSLDSKLTSGARFMHFTMSPEAKRQHFESLLRSPDLFHFNSFEKAQAELSFKLFEPKHPLLKGKRVTIFITKDEKKEDREVRIFYGDPANPIGIKVGKLLATDSWFKDPNGYFDKYIEKARREKEKGYSKADALPQIVYIGGHKGVGIEPGYNILGNDKEPRPGVVNFIVDGIYYKVIGTVGENATTLEELIEIAESMLLK